MGKIMHDYIEDYIRNLIPDHEGMLKQLEDYAVDNNVPIVHKETAKISRIYGKCKKAFKNIGAWNSYRLFSYFNGIKFKSKYYYCR